MAKTFLKNRILAAVLISLIITAILSVGIFLNVFNSQHLRNADTLYTYSSPSDQIEIIAIDNKSTNANALGNVNRWSRDYFTDILKVLDDLEPKAIVLDVTFSTTTSAIPRTNILQFISDTEESKDSQLSESYKEFLESFIDISNNPIDERLRAQVNTMNNLILVNNFEDNNGNLLPHIISEQNVSISYIEPDEDGVIRRAIPNFTINNKEYYDIAVAAVKMYLEKDELNLLTEDGNLIINYFGDPFSYNYTPFVDVLNEKADMSKFKDKIVLIGLSAEKTSTDRHVTPRSNTTLMPGIEIRANEIQTILEEKFLVNQSKLSQTLTVFLVTLILTILFNYLSILVSIPVVLTSLGLYYLSARFAFKQGLILNMVYPFIAIVFAYIASWIYRYFIADRKGRELKGAFKHYISDKLVDQISKNPDMVKLGGEKREITIFFSDIQDSTKHSEQSEITSWISQINEYFTAMEYIIQKYSGTIDKYEGDAIMGFFNAPLSDPKHMLNAYNAALEMKAMLKNLHAKWQRDGKPLIQFRIGINTGEALVGNFGSNNRFDYTAMGDTVNTASRLESSANKTYGTHIILTAPKEKLQQIKEQIIYREIDTVILPGKDQPVTLYEPICRASESSTNSENIRSKYSKGLEFYKAKDFKNAISYFSCLENDRPSKIMLGRCQTLAAGGQVDGLDQNMIFHIKHK